MVNWCKVEPIVKNSGKLNLGPNLNQSFPSFRFFGSRTPLSANATIEQARVNFTARCAQVRLWGRNEQLARPKEDERQSYFDVAGK